MNAVSRFVAGELDLRRAVLASWLLGSLYLLCNTPMVFGIRNLDTDDVMRLVQVRDLMAGQGWFDLAQHRVATDPALVMHWSRLVDAPLAVLIGLLELFLTPDLAERVAAAMWPCLVLLPTLAVSALVADSLGGRRAVPLVLILFLVGNPAATQYMPGRIDHHNVQILACLAALAGVLRMDRSARMGLAAGGAVVFGLGVGIEALPYYIVLCGAVGLLASVDPDRWGGGAVRFALALVVSAILVCAIAIPPAQWSSQACDALSAPYIAALLGGALGLAAGVAAARRLPHPGARVVAMVVLAGTPAAAGLFLAGPACALGPVAAIDPRIVPMWLSKVYEMKPLWPLVREADHFALTLLLDLALAVVAAGVMWRLAPARRPEVLVIVALLAAAFATTLGQIRAGYYLASFAMPLIVGAIVVVLERLSIQAERWNVSALGSVLGAIAPMLVFSMLPSAASATAGSSRGGSPSEHARAGQGRPGDAAAMGCWEPVSYGVLARQPGGIVLGEVDVGPFVLAATSRHRVFGTPYHRSPEGILASFDLMAASVETAHAMLWDKGVRYVAYCGEHGGTKDQAALRTRLAAGQPPAWLDLISAQNGVAIYRLAPPR